MKKLHTFDEFLNERLSNDVKKHPADRLHTKVRHDQYPDALKNKGSKPDAHQQEDMHPFSLGDLKSHIEKGTEKAEDDMESTEQKIKDNKEIKAGDFVLHKHRQNLGVGNVQKIHPDGKHAEIHFVKGLKSSLADDDEQEKDKHTMELKHLMPVIGTQG